jgi:hypothetical protein
LPAVPFCGVYKEGSHCSSRIHFVKVGCTLSGQHAARVTFALIRIKPQATRVSFPCKWVRRSRTQSVLGLPLWVAAIPQPAHATVYVPFVAVAEHVAWGTASGRS